MCRSPGRTRRHRRRSGALRSRTRSIAKASGVLPTGGRRARRLDDVRASVPEGVDVLAAPPSELEMELVGRLASAAVQMKGEVSVHEIVEVVRPLRQIQGGPEQ